MKASWWIFGGCWIVLAGCSSVSERAATEPEDGQTVRDAGHPLVLEPAVRYVASPDSPGVTQAVVVEGYPLVHTRQFLPLDAEGQIVGQGAVEPQVERVLNDLSTVLESAGSSLNRLVRLNIYADSPATVDLVRERFNGRIDPAVRPAITTVQSPLGHPDALVAVDAIATTDEQVSAVALHRCEAVAGNPDFADYAVMPPGGVAYLSGHPDRSPAVAKATAKSLAALLEIVQQLELDPSQIVHLKVFVQPAQAADEVMTALKRGFPGQRIPPVVIAEWIASAPVEIEMIVHRPLPVGPPAETVAYYNPVGVKPSPTFSRVALVQTARQIYIAGLTARQPGDGEAQVRDVFEQLQQILAQTGSDLRHLAKATYYVSDDDASTKLNELRPEFYDPQRPPAASKCTVHGVGSTDRTLALDMIAVGTE